MKKLYSDLAGICHEFYKQYFPHRNIAARLDAILKKHGCKKVVFIGGLVYVAALLKRKGYDLTFVDYTPEMLAEAKPLLKGVPMCCCDMRSLKLKTKADAVVAVGRSFTYMYDDADALKALSSFRRALKPGGIVVIDNYEVGKIDKGPYFTGTVMTRSGKVLLMRRSSIQPKKKKPALYTWSCTYAKFVGRKAIVYKDEGHLLRAFAKDETKALIEKSGLDFVGHLPNFERLSFVSVAQKNA